MNVYMPDKYTVSIGIPASLADQFNIPAAYIHMRDWVSITSEKPIPLFRFRAGIWSEPFPDMTKSTQRVINYSVLQSSDEVRLLRELLRLQTFGEIGFPFTMTDDAQQSNSTLLRQKSAYPVAFILDEPSEAWALEGATWVYKIQLVAGVTVYA